MDFQYYSPTRLIVGRGKIAEAGGLLEDAGEKVFVVAGRSAETSGILDRLCKVLQSHQKDPVPYIKPPGEPTVSMTDQAAEVALQVGCSAVISLGGGSAIDLAKAVAGLVTNGVGIEDYLEGVGSGKPVTKPALPHIAIPTTAGTGAEMTRNAVIRSTEGRFKKSFRSPYLYPSAAILDAELTVSLPTQQTAFSGMDAITQLIESYLSRKSAPLTDALALCGIEMALRSIRGVYTNGADLERREEMLLASALSGVCLANAGLGMAHGFAAGLGALYDIPHGKACAILLPYAMQYNRDVSLEKLARIGKFLTPGDKLTQDELANRVIYEVEALTREFNIPSDLKTLPIQTEEIPLLANMSMGNSMSGNPREITIEKAEAILRELL